MDKTSIDEYYRKIDNIRNIGKTNNERSLRIAFDTLLEKYTTEKGLQYIPEHKLSKSRKVPDGTILNSAGFKVGYYESKDTDDNLEEEINKKLRIYPNFNILFEDTETIVLYQDGNRYQGKIAEKNKLDEILTKFVNYQTLETTDYYQAITDFKNNLPKVLSSLKIFLTEQLHSNETLKLKRREFVVVCRASINKEIRVEDIDEMIIQHILTNEIFSSIFDKGSYHSENIVAKQLNDVVNTFFIGDVRENFKLSTDKFYKAIKARASAITDTHEKQKFLKEIYEQFYKTYNPKLADKFGVVYTPNEIVSFIIKGTDHLLSRLLDKTISEKDVELIDPATGTGTFICYIIDHIANRDLESKYNNEIHANEISILPYYVANLNIEATYSQKMNKYNGFKNICFVDTLELLSHKHTSRSDKKEQGDMFNQFSENLERINRQNSRKISIVVGNPPYNANQISENDNNKNKTYSRKDFLGVDDRIKETYIKNSSAQKTKVYDMYARFFRWATDRIENDGMVSFITNNSFLSKRTFDGFRKSVIKEFQHIYIIDLGGELRGKEKNVSNVFGITTGVAISFMIKKQGDKDMPCQINYFKVDLPTKESKLEYLSSTELKDVPFIRIKPNDKGDWLNQSFSDFNELLPIGNKLTKLGKEETALFKLYTNGVVTNRDEWVFDFDAETLKNKMEYFIEKYSDLLNKYIEDFKAHPHIRDLSKYFTDKIKWSEGLKQSFKRNQNHVFDIEKIKSIQYRPFTSKYYYADKIFSDRLTGNHNEIFGNNFELKNKVITISTGERARFSVLATDKLMCLDLFMPNSAQCISLYTYEYDKTIEDYITKDNITDFGLLQFKTNYKNDAITKIEIFNYTYAVLHYPAYIKEYERDLEGSLPSIPFYEDFYKWEKLGSELMSLHIDYNTVELYDLEIKHTKVSKPKPKLKANKNKGEIIIDESTTLKGIPNECWEYYLGNRTAIDWVLDQHKEKGYSDKSTYGKVLNEKYNTYRLADSKNDLIKLIQRICTISVETKRIIDKLKE